MYDIITIHVEDDKVSNKIQCVIRPETCRGYSCPAFILLNKPEVIPETNERSGQGVCGMVPGIAAYAQKYWMQ